MDQNVRSDGNKHNAKDKITREKRLNSLSTFLRQRPVLASVTVIMTILLISALALGGYILYLHLQQLQASSTVPTNTEADFYTKTSTEPITNSTTTTSSELDYYMYINRSASGLLPPNNILTPLAMPTRRIIIAHTATSICSDLESCCQRIRAIQTSHMHNLGYSDIGINFFVGGDGRAYEGRGYNVGAHTVGYNANSICISFIGNFMEYAVPELQILAAKRFIEDNMKTGNIDSDYALYGHRQVSNTNSPGDYLYDQIKTWEHWKDSVIPL